MSKHCRINYMVAEYATITLRHYGQVKLDFTKLESITSMSEEAIILQSRITHNCIITVTFAAMTLEAFFNDFAARALGDKIYYENFDTLRPMGKLHLIANFILNKPIEKNSRLFYHTVTLFKNRNELVHNKSKQFASGINEDDLESFIEYNEHVPNIHENTLHIIKLETKELLKTATHALYALKDVWSFINENCPEMFYVNSLLLTNMAVFSSTSEEVQMIKCIQTELGVPTILND